MKWYRNYILVFVIAGTLVIQGFRTEMPKVFVIGDSISIFYGPYLKKALSGFFTYDRKRGVGEAMQDLDNPVGANGGDSQMVLDYMRELQRDSTFTSDFFLINCGLHDIKHKSKEGPAQINLKEYKKNLSEIVRISNEMKIKMVWVNSTPVVDSIHNKRVPFLRFNRDVIQYNMAADSIMQAAGVPVIDLYTFTEKFIPQGYMDHVHYVEAVRREQADFIAGSLVAIKDCDDE
ncbi:MAG: SGNH/GDSL hydrolase family protein [Flavobacteriaceae bacterium]|nr:SGNH/GDSL hydrolase family protein [Flavobacteriaceae bacterium]